MDRRDFLRNAVQGSSLLLLPSLSLLPLQAQAAVSLSQRLLVSLALPGGPDFRHLLPPVFTANEASDSYAFAWWSARASSQGIAAANRNRDGYYARWLAGYDAVNLPGTSQAAPFGILKRCGWLKSMWDQGHVALIHNVVGADSRDHSHAELVMDHGDRSSASIDMDKAGWGGRLAAALNAKVVALTYSPRPFCFGPHPSNPISHRNDQLINVANSRNLALPEFVDIPAETWRRTQSQHVMARALKGYYAGKSFTTGTPQARYAGHERNIRQVGAQLRAALGTGETLAEGAVLPVPSNIRSLYVAPGTGQTDLRLSNEGFGQQIRNLHDTIHVADVLNMRVASLSYGGWDTHQGQQADIESNFSDLFKTGGALDTLWQNLTSTARDNLVLVIYGEFGRQLAGNGDNGTDHGVGNTVLLIGGRVRGGSYGAPFPTNELGLFARDRNDDIAGLTAVEHVFGAASDWVAGADTGNTVIRNRSASAGLLEAGVNPAQFFL